uniref:YqhA family protein n=1 Tax=Micromonas pusilla TaxID=38833 RepID=A0A7R9Y0H2_MICPS|mmetsp:Transcript_3753/g.12906  ORF Transcript_3753/g.12906 Transcript_3753/m.12906 type:complete len:293 (+) Transcript_3753:201-1079(+)
MTSAHASTAARAAPRVAARREVRSSSSASARGTADLLGFGFARAASAGRVARSSAAETSGDAETSGVVLLDPPPAPAPVPAPAAAPAATTTTPPVDASQTSLRRVARHVHREAEYVFVRFSLLATGAFVLIGVCASLALSALLFSMGVKEVLYEAVGAWMQFSPVGLVTAAVGALDRFLLGMVCLVFGLGSFELFLARSSRKEEQQLAKRVNKPLWLRVRSIDDLEHKVGEIIVAVMVVNLLEMSLHMTYSKPVDLVWAALAALASAGALALLHWSSENHCGKDDDAPCAVH